MSLHDIRLSRGNNNHSNWRRSQSSNSPQSLYIDTLIIIYGQHFQQPLKAAVEITSFVLPPILILNITAGTTIIIAIMIMTKLMTMMTTTSMQPE